MMRYNDETDKKVKNNYLKYAYMYSENIFLIGDCSNDKILREYFKNNNVIITGRISYSESNNITNFFKNISIKGYKNRDKDLFLITSLDVYENLKIINILNGVGVKIEQIISAGYFLLDILAEFKGFYSAIATEYTLPTYASFDLVDTCNLRCSTCMRKDNRGTSGKMEYEVFTRCLDKLCRLGIYQVEMHKSTEPFLHPDIVDYCAEVKKRGMSFILSTNLSLINIGKKARLVADLMNDQDMMVISISGLSQEIYQINHQGGCIENIVNNLCELSMTTGCKKNVVLRLLKFDYNAGEIPEVIDLANKLGISYQIMNAYGDPVVKELANTELPPFDFNMQDYNHIFERLNYCSWLFERNLVINHKGNVHLCCNCDPIDNHDLGPFLTQDFSVVQLKRYIHPVCARCVGARGKLADSSQSNIYRIQKLIHDGISAQMKKNELCLSASIDNYNIKTISDYFVKKVLS